MTTEQVAFSNPSTMDCFPSPTETADLLLSFLSCLKNTALLHMFTLVPESINHLLVINPSYVFYPLLIMNKQQMK